MVGAIRPFSFVLNRMCELLHEISKLLQVNTKLIFTSFRNGIQTYTEIKTSSNHVTVSGLKARHVYEVELLARNMYGKSDTTTPLQTRTAGE